MITASNLASLFDRTFLKNRILNLATPLWRSDVEAADGQRQLSALGITSELSALHYLVARADDDCLAP